MSSGYAFDDGYYFAVGDAVIFYTNAIGTVTLDESDKVNQNSTWTGGGTNAIKDDLNSTWAGRLSIAPLFRTAWIIMTNLNLSISSTFWTTNISIKIKTWGNNTDGDFTNVCTLLNDGSPVGNVYTSANFTMPTTNEFGGPMVGTWGTNLTEADIEPTGFGFKW